MTWICGVCIINGKKIILATLAEIISHIEEHLRDCQGNSAEKKRQHEEELLRLIRLLQSYDFLED